MAFEVRPHSLQVTDAIVRSQDDGVRFGRRHGSPRDDGHALWCTKTRRDICLSSIARQGLPRATATDIATNVSLILLRRFVGLLPHLTLTKARNGRVDVQVAAPASAIDSTDLYI